MENEYRRQSGVERRETGAGVTSVGVVLMGLTCFRDFGSIIKKLRN